MKRTLLIILPPAIVAVFYLLFLGHRTDYVGHFMAGFGGTFVVMAIGLARPRSQDSGNSRDMLILILLVACIAIGAIEEATTFRLAKFDEIDFFNQTLGAILGAAIAMVVDKFSPGDRSFPVVLAMVTGVLFLAAGFIYAFI